MDPFNQEALARSQKEIASLKNRLEKESQQLALTKSRYNDSLMVTEELQKAMAQATSEAESEIKNLEDKVTASVLEAAQQETKKKAAEEAIEKLREDLQQTELEMKDAKERMIEGTRQARNEADIRVAVHVGEQKAAEFKMKEALEAIEDAERRMKEEFTPRVKPDESETVWPDERTTGISKSFAALSASLQSRNSLHNPPLFHSVQSDDEPDALQDMDDEPYLVPSSPQRNFQSPPKGTLQQEISGKRKTLGSPAVLSSMLSKTSPAQVASFLRDSGTKVDASPELVSTLLNSTSPSVVYTLLSELDVTQEADRTNDVKLSTMREMMSLKLAESRKTFIQDAKNETVAADHEEDHEEHLFSRIEPLFSDLLEHEISEDVPNETNEKPQAECATEPTTCPDPYAKEREVCVQVNTLEPANAASREQIDGELPQYLDVKEGEISVGNTGQMVPRNRLQPNPISQAPKRIGKGRINAAKTTFEKELLCPREQIRIHPLVHKKMVQRQQALEKLKEERQRSIEADHKVKEQLVYAEKVTRERERLQLEQAERIEWEVKRLELARAERLDVERATKLDQLAVESSVSKVRVEMEKELLKMKQAFEQERFQFENEKQLREVKLAMDQERKSLRLEECTSQERNEMNELKRQMEYERKMHEDRLSLEKEKLSLEIQRLDLRKTELASKESNMLTREQLLSDMANMVTSIKSEGEVPRVPTVGEDQKKVISTGNSAISDYWGAKYNRLHPDHPPDVTPTSMYTNNIHPIEDAAAPSGPPRPYSNPSAWAKLFGAKGR